MIRIISPTNRQLRPLVDSVALRCGGFDGAPIRILFRPSLTATGGKLLSNAGRGQPVHAGSFIRKREIVLETELRADAGELARIFTHELFHFVWIRIGNSRRKAYEALLRREIDSRARGELGWSAESRKCGMSALETDRAWRAYVCESFCDTAAFLYSGCRKNDEYTLAPRWRRIRKEWFAATFGRRGVSI